MEVLSISCPEMRISLCLFVPETSFLQAVNLTVLLNMKHNLVKSYFCMVNYSISNKMHFAFIVSVLFLMFHICWISYLNAYHLWQWILSGSIWNYINTTSEIFGFSSPTLFVGCIMFMFWWWYQALFHLFTNSCWMGTLKNCFGDMVKHLLVRMI